jgi:hypothetical protein
MASYAASRRRMWRKRRASPPPTSDAVGRTILPKECSQQILDPGADRVQHEGPHGVRLEYLADDRRVLQDHPFFDREAVEARREERRDRGRDLDRREIQGGDPLVILLDQDAVVEQHLQHLLDEQGVALRGGSDALTDLGGESRVTEDVLDQRVRLRFRQRLQVHARRVPLPTAPP